VRNKKPQSQDLGNCGWLLPSCAKERPIKHATHRIDGIRMFESRRWLFSRFGCKRPQIPSVVNTTIRSVGTQAASIEILPHVPRQSPNGNPPQGTSRVSQNPCHASPIQLERGGLDGAVDVT